MAIVDNLQVQSAEELEASYTARRTALAAQLDRQPES
jgi:hypothetical protein